MNRNSSSTLSCPVTYHALLKDPVLVTRYSLMHYLSRMKLIQPLVLAAALLGFALPSSSEDLETLNIAEFTFKYGDPWVRQQPSSSMRAAQFTYDHEDENLKDIEVVFFAFGGNAGGVQANMDRWIGQFEGNPEYKIEEKELGGKEISFIAATGTFMETMGGGGPFSGGEKKAMPDYTMLAAFIQGADQAVILKLTGPSDSVEAMKEAFEALATSPFTD